jgi:hypothetical protein
MAAADALAHDEAALLRRLVALAMAPRRPSIWEQPPRALLESAAAAYLLLGAEPGDAGTFLLGGLEGLTRELSRSSTQHTVSDQRGLRGRVLWGPTVAIQAERGDGGPAYVYREVRHQYDTPENQLLRHTLEGLAHGLQRLAPALRAGVCYTRVDGTLEPRPAAARLERLEAALLRARACAGLRAVTPLARVEARHLARAETARNEAYATVSKMYRQHVALLDPQGWRDALAALGRRVLVLPAGDGPEAEPWIELAAIALRGHGAGGT